MTDQPSLLQDATAEELQRLLDEDAGLPEAQRRWAPALADLVRVIEAAHRRRGAGSTAAFTAAVESVTAIADFFGGRPVYIPRGDRLKQALRDAEIFRRANGRNIHALAEEHQLSVQSVYEILREQKALHLRKIQGQLFDHDNQGKDP